MEDIQWPADNRPSARWPIYTRGNVGEVLPGIVLPLEWSIGGPAAEKGWRDGAAHVGFLSAADFDTDSLEVIGVFGGYAYFNASLMRLLGVRTPGLAIDVIDTQFLGDADVPAYSPQPGDKNLIASMKMVRTALRTFTAKNVPRVEKMRRQADAVIASAPSLDAADETLWNFVSENFVGQFAELTADHVINTMQATIAAGQLTDLCEKKLGDPNLAISLTTGIGEVVSAEPARAMWRLANETDPADFDSAFEEFLVKHGHRGPNEFSMAGRDWAAYPELAHAAINTMRGAGQDRSPAVQAERIVLARDEALERAQAKMKLGFRRLQKAIATTALWSRAREESKDQIIRANQPARHAYLELVRRAAANGGVDDPIGPMLLTEDEFMAYLEDPKTLVATIEDRRAQLEKLESLEPPFAFDASLLDGMPPPISTWNRRETDGAAVPKGTVLRGSAGAPGIARGTARVITDPGDPSALQPGDILVAPLTDPSWTPLFVAAGGVVVEVGAAMSHSMIVSRELGIPCVVGVPGATLSIGDGAELEIDGQAGTVTIL